MKLTKPNDRQKAYIKALKEIALKNPEGFSVDYKTLKPINKNIGFMIGLTDNDKGSFETKAKKLIYAKNNLFKKVKCYIGYWYDKETKNHILDLSIYHNQENASLTIGKALKQKALFNLKTFQEVKVN